MDGKGAAHFPDFTLKPAPWPSSLGVRFRPVGCGFDPQPVKPKTKIVEL